jgi:hypothetical protein
MEPSSKRCSIVQSRRDIRVCARRRIPKDSIEPRFRNDPPLIAVIDGLRGEICANVCYDKRAKYRKDHGGCVLACIAPWIGKKIMSFHDTEAISD